jgi:hypothetical protein
MLLELPIQTGSLRVSTSDRRLSLGRHVLRFVGLLCARSTTFVGRSVSTSECLGSLVGRRLSTRHRSLTTTSLSSLVAINKIRVMARRISVSTRNVLLALCVRTHRSDDGDFPPIFFHFNRAVLGLLRHLLYFSVLLMNVYA